MKGIYKRSLISSIITMGILGLGVGLLIKYGEDFTSLSINTVIEQAFKTLNYGIIFYGICFLLIFIVFCIRLGRNGVTKKDVEKRFFRGPVIILIRSIIVLLIIFQGGMLYLSSQKFSEERAEMYKKIVNETEASLEMTLLRNEREGIYSYKVFEKEEDLKELKEVYKVSDNIKRVTYGVNYDEKFLNVSVNIDFKEIDKGIIEDSYKLSRFIKLNGKEVISKKLIEESLESYRNGNYAEAIDVFGDGYLEARALIVGDYKSINISLAETYQGVRDDGNK